MFLLLIVTCLTAFVSGQESLGISVPVLKDVCKLDFDVGPCNGALPVWSFDSSKGICVKQIYGGCRGNGNRFQTEEQCNNHCQDPDVCKLKFDAGPCLAFESVFAFNSSTNRCEKQVYGGCKGNGNKFQTIEACEKRCREPDVCKLDFDVGPCNGAFPVWSFESSRAICVKQIYGGCGGNGNRFQTEEQCNNRCQDPDVCKLKFDVGPCLAFESVFAFNSSTNRCEIQVYGGCRGNGNKFQTIEACEKRCREPGVCGLQFDGGLCNGYVPVYAFNSTTNLCEQKIYGGCGGNLNRFQTKSECESLCNNKDVCKLDFDVGPCNGAVPVWSFDSSEGICVKQIYGGCRGNGNRFQTEEQCNNRCQYPDVCKFKFVAGPCLAYIPVFAFNSSTNRCEIQVYGGCRGNGNKFRTIEACEKRCREPDVCGLKFDGGLCGSYFPVYAFNSATNLCEKKIYGGCGGNGNRFQTKSECESLCNNKDVCKLDFDVGPCNGAVPVWYFDSSKGICVEQIYGGCGGNGNRFQTEEQCNNRCQDPDVCKFKFVVGFCKAYEPVFAFNSSTNRCEIQVYGGCGGNGNKFRTIEACEKRCREPDVCGLQFDGGLCYGYFPVYAFNSTTSLCEKKIYGGCGGYGNRFQTKSECESLCNNKDVCKLDFDVGLCKAAIPVWSFDSSRGICVEKIYGGCRGNGNRFQTEEQCKNRCQYPDICKLEFEVGPCKKFVPVYAYDSASGECKKQIYGGCKGNGNRFETKTECENVCKI